MLHSTDAGRRPSVGLMDSDQQREGLSLGDLPRVCCEGGWLSCSITAGTCRSGVMFVLCTQPFRSVHPQEIFRKQKRPAPHPCFLTNLPWDTIGNGLVALEPSKRPRGQDSALGRPARRMSDALTCAPCGFLVSSSSVGPSPSPQPAAGMWDGWGREGQGEGSHRSRERGWHWVGVQTEKHLSAIDE